jgi:hypothetical protein
MAAFGPIEFWGIAVGRAVTICHGTVDDMSSSSSEISFSSLDIDEEKSVTASRALRSRLHSDR